MDRGQMGVLLLVLGLLVAAHPLYLGLNPGDTTVDVRVEPADDVAVEEVAGASELPESSQAAVEEAVADGEVTLWRGADRTTVDPLIANDYVRVDGETYRVRVFAPNGLFDRVDTVVSPLVALIGVLGAFVGTRTYWDTVREDGRVDRDA